MTAQFLSWATCALAASKRRWERVYCSPSPSPLLVRSVRCLRHARLSPSIKAAHSDLIQSSTGLRTTFASSRTVARKAHTADQCAARISLQRFTSLLKAPHPTAPVPSSELPKNGLIIATMSVSPLCVSRPSQLRNNTLAHYYSATFTQLAHTSRHQ